MSPKNTWLLLSLLPWFLFAQSPQLTSPEEFLGYPLGQTFTYTHEAEAYLKHMSQQSAFISILPYGASYQGRNLLVAVLGSEKNLANLERIQKSNRSRAQLESGEIMDDQPIIVWLSFNIHGNEAVSTETALELVYDLASKAETAYAELFSNTLVIIDPCLNPDGHNRYVQFFRGSVGKKPNPQLFTREHWEPWPGGRPNHYLFDLNRDWAWQTQIESKARAKLFNQWMPHVHIDFHEMGINSPYYFAPSADPIHSDLPAWLLTLQDNIGRNIAAEFDQKHWLYFKKEIFDLFYPSYGDTYPSFNGAIGMTFEQGGSGRAGLAGISQEGDTLTLRDRMDHHYWAALKALEVCSQERENILLNFGHFFSSSIQKPKGEYKSFVVREKNADKLKSLLTFLNQLEIQYGSPTSKGVELLCFDYFLYDKAKIKIQKEDIVIPLAQAKGALVKALFEPQPVLSDTMTYDITAWALPYSMGFQCYASHQAISWENYLESPTPKRNLINKEAIAYALAWNSIEDVKFLSQALQLGYRPRVLEEPATFGRHHLERGSLIFTKTRIESKDSTLDRDLFHLALACDRDLMALETGYSDKGPSFGSEKLHKIKAPSVALLSGEGTVYTSVGEIWHFFDQEIDYPLHLIGREQIQQAVLEKIDVLILPDMRSRALEESDWETLKNWVQRGGKLIAIESAVNYLAQKNIFSIAKKEKKSPVESKASEGIPFKKYADREREAWKNQNPGAILPIQLDNTHPLGYGYGTIYYGLKTNQNLYQGLSKGWNVGFVKDTAHTIGFVGSEFKKELKDFLCIGTENVGKGQVVYFNDNPLFRSFWHSGKLMMANAVFFVGE
jgi:hypothetical protein